jgi:hypothetical protein
MIPSLDFLLSIMSYVRHPADESLFQGKGFKSVRNLIMDSYKDAFIQIQTKNRITERIEIGKGVKQGCPLSSILFNIDLDPLLRNIKSKFQE